MIRATTLVLSLLTGALVAVPAGAEDPPKKLAAEERKTLEAKGRELIGAGLKAYQAGKYPEATESFEAALAVARRLYAKNDFPDGHENLAGSLNNLAFLYQAQGKLADAEPLAKDALDMYKRLFKGDHPNVATSLNNLAGLYEAQAKLADAEPLFKDALDMRKRLFKGDHPDVATSLSNLTALYQAQGKLADAEPLFKDALAMRKRLFKGDHTDVANSLNNLAELYRAQGKLADAETLYIDALAMKKRLFKSDHPDLAISLNNLAALYRVQGKLAETEPLFKDALAMHKRLFKGDHPDVAASLNNLAGLYMDQGKLADAEPLSKGALAMRKRLFKGDHPAVATSLNNLAGLYKAQGKLADAERLTKDALAMRKRLFKGDHPAVAISLNALAVVYDAQGKLTDAELLLKDSLAMDMRLFKGDHPAVATSMNNLAYLYQAQGKPADAEPLYKDALDMNKRLFKGDHPAVVSSLNNLAFLSLAQGKLADAAPHCKDALAMSCRLTTEFAKQKAEGEALTLLASLPLYRDGFLSVALQRKSDPATVYPEVWASKGAVARVYEQRQQQARAAASDPAAARLLAELADTRSRRAELLLAPQVKDPATREKRDDDLKYLDAKIADLDRNIRPLLPVIARAEKLADAKPDELQKVLPADAAVVDYLHYTFFEYDKDKPVEEREKQTERYLAFVVTKDRIKWVDLDTADRIRTGVAAWRGAITGGKEIPAAIPAWVRDLVWEKVRKELPASVKTVYLSPDADLCRLPWTALPGDKPGTILLEDFAVASIPHAGFLLDKLSPQEPVKNPPTGAFVVGGVKYDAELIPATDVTGSPAIATRGGPLVKPNSKLGWSFLENTVAEANGFVAVAERKKFRVTRLDGDTATTAAVLAALPKAKYAHLATHGFFADPSFRSVFQLDPKDYEKSRRGERIGKAANSPLVMTGLVFAGANNPKTPSRGIATGEALIDLDLSGLDLAVLSACETGLGDVAGGEGTFGLQRAFHMAGTRDVIASLWKVPDQSTAALMALFYRNLWEKNLSPMESLRQAQLEIYRNPGKIAELAKGFRGKFVEEPGMGGEVTIKPNKDGTAHPLLWAAFTLSGPGR